MDTVIQIDGLTKWFGNKQAVGGLTLDIPRGAIFALLGENGAGKTTTIRMLTGLLPPDAGWASILGMNPWRDAIRLRHRLGYVPERPKFYDWMTVSEVGWFTSGFHAKGFLPRYRKLADRFDLDPAARLGHLSKGQYAKVGLSLALASDPRVLILDEPTSGLDLLTRREFLASLVDLAAAGRTVLISSHSIAELEKASTHVGLLRDGKMILSATLDDLRKKVRRISLRFADSPPDPLGLGTVLERNGTGRFWQVLVQDPDAGAVAALRGGSGVSDFEDAAVTLEEVYAALMARAAPAAANGPAIPMVRKVDAT